MNNIQHISFLEVLKDVSAGNTKLLQKDFLESGKYPIIDQGQSLVAGYTDNIEFLCKAKPPVIIFGDHTRAVKYIDFPFVMGADGTKILIPKNNDDPKYLYYAIKSINLEGAGYSRHFKFLKEKTIPLPPLPEQKRIAAILDAADALRTQRRQSIAELDLLLQSTFLEMFGDPVENPKGWEMCKLEVIANKITDGTHKTPIYTESGIEFLSAKDIKNSKVQWGTGKFISQEEHNQLIKRCNPEMGDVLMAKSGSLGAVAIIDKNHEFSLFESLCLIKSRKELIDANFLLAMLSNTSMQKHLLEKNKGVAIKHLHLVDIRNLIILLPSLNEQQHFVSFSKAIERQKTRLQAHLAELDTLFASLQQRAFNGEL